MQTRIGIATADVPNMGTTAKVIFFSIFAKKSNVG